MKNKNTFCALLVIVSAIFFTFSAASAAEEFHCEVLSITGSASVLSADGRSRPLSVGDLIAKNETVETGEKSVVDVSFDKDWKNVARFEEKSKIKMAAVYPARLNLKQGGVFAKLKGLPKDSSFEIQTPTAVASVRGTEYRTTFINGQTDVFNISSSKVFVYGVKVDGSVDRNQKVVLEQSKKTQVAAAGEIPKAPEGLSADEQKIADTSKAEIQAKIEEAVSSGRVAKIQSVADIEAMDAKFNNTDESRVVDLRRRPFKKVEPPAEEPPAPPQ